MYKVFVNKHSLFLSKKPKKNGKILSFPLRTVKLTRVLDEMYEGNLKSVCLFHPEKESILKLFSKKVPLVIAGGGVVKNSNEEILFIFRNGKWDLPKGKLDKGETIEEAAIREVEEETGVKDLKITRFLDKTYHIFKRNGKYKLKETYWYEMKTKYEGELFPQCEEGIEKVAWKKDEKIDKALKNSYNNIKSLLEDYDGLE
ncbi:NUDIX hydrolase [Abyssalbus ytuae]|uniref:NUDIX domain-containing protein n=1 Tax=Abyssalbus ytuae TaxID=2926907 RepID=A0A9E7CYU7_9FLAO|nr:NUDIX domain-containing protein [Abyssalbus ytuae]UOB17005.1 NUDIX domain-containing protein [Abyssalbus ytuae]